MKLLFKKIKTFLNTIESQIAFYPTIIAIFGCLFAFTLIYLENLGISRYLRENLPMLVLDNEDTARSLLSVFIGGLISLMVFSFSMVMVLLNQASSNFSPRILPGLISNRKHQLVLGSFLATLLYCIFILVSIEPIANEDKIPGFSVLISIILTVFCLAAFVYFIHSISQSIQINNILESIFNTSKARLLEIIKNQKPSKNKFPDTSNWYCYNSNRSGYFQNASIEALLQISKEKETKFKILVAKGNFVLHGVPLFSSEKKLDEETINNILSAFIFAKGELIENNYVLAFKQITEITVKAMSPGINDPGTALNAIDYLTELLAIRMKKEDISIYSNEDEVLIYHTSISFEELLYNIMASIRLYCKHDIIIIQKLMIMFRFLHFQECIDANYKKVILEEVKTLINDAENNLTSNRDKKALSKQLNFFDIKIENS